MQKPIVVYHTHVVNQLPFETKLKLRETIEAIAESGYFLSKE
ncbi:DUF2332 domain-containing protein [Neobacillus notoginsengisoli]|nr:DUF2332 domain-containing protein [Neobacillus notoginsengisoli]